jgi:hypothetical protein
MNKNDFRVGDQISFNYNGGSRPGAIRIIDIKEVNNTTIRGFDHFNKDDRTFSYNKMCNIRFLYSVPRVNIIKYIKVEPHNIVVEIVCADGSKIGIDCYNNTFVINGVAIKSVNDFKKIV